MARDWTPDERAAHAERRRRAVESTLGSLRIEGLEVDAEARVVMDRYIDGDLEIDDVVAALTRYPY